LDQRLTPEQCEEIHRLERQRIAALDDGQGPSTVRQALSQPCEILPAFPGPTEDCKNA
jgi:hypothetical protein